MTKDAQSTQDELERQGWTRQFITDEPRLSEAVAMYRSLGLDVRLESVLPGTPGTACGQCYLPQCADRHKVIYTRPAIAADGDAANQELPFDE